MNDELEWHLDPSTGPKRILALDGGGVRGLVTLGILQRIEDLLKQRCPRPDAFRLHHYFDLIAGTSTGSIIATGLALGMKVAEIREIYDRICPSAFTIRARGLWKPVYDHTTVETELKRFLGTEQLQSDKLKTGLMICAKRFDSGSPWVLTNNPRSKYWNSEDKSHKPNKEYELWMLVRASTAAPLYFEPVEVTITEEGQGYDEQVGLFIDGAVGGFNNPSQQALMVATLPSYRFGWRTGAKNLHMVSVGTGWWRMRKTVVHLKRLYNWQKASEALAAMIQDTVLHSITAMQAISTPRKPWLINSEIGHMTGERIVAEDVLSYQRYDAIIDADTVSRVCNLGEPASVQVMTAVDALRKIGSADRQTLERLYALGVDSCRVRRPGADGIEAEDFPAHFDPPFVEDAAA
jgi:hypothetical protein